MTRKKTFREYLKQLILYKIYLTKLKTNEKM